MDRNMARMLDDWLTTEPQPMPVIHMCDQWDCDEIASATVELPIGSDLSDGYTWTFWLCPQHLGWCADDYVEGMMFSD